MDRFHCKVYMNNMPVILLFVCLLDPDEVSIKRRLQHKRRPMHDPMVSFSSPVQTVEVSEYTSHSTPLTVPFLQSRFYYS